MPDAAASPHEATYVVWLVSFGMALALSGVGMAWLILRRQPRSRLAWRVCACGTLIPTSLAFVDACELLSQVLASPPTLTGSAWLVGAMPTLGCLARALGLLGDGQERSPRVWQVPTLVAVNALAALWSSQRFRESVGPELPPAVCATTPLGQVHVAFTDRGRAISLYAVPAAPCEPSSRPGPPGTKAEIPGGGRIEMAPPNSQSNCHGWVFTGGRFFLTAADVDLVLADNGYQRVEQPSVGDLILYEGGSHSGVVKAVGDDGLVLVESKWGLQGRYLHRPEAYTLDFDYYHSPRSGHLLRGVGEEGPTDRGTLNVVARFPEAPHHAVARRRLRVHSPSAGRRSYAQGALPGALRPASGPS